jgi:superfamily I DNA/RNA helicase
LATLTANQCRTVGPFGEDVRVREYVLRRSAAESPPAPRLDASQQAVVDHVSGPLLVLAGPGTGKTTTLVEVVVDRVENRGLRPEEILVLTFSRKAAQEIRGRIARRLARTTAATPAMTFHSFGYALLRAEQDPADFSQPIRLLSAPEYDAALGQVLAGMDRSAWPDDLRPALGTRGIAGELRTFLAAARAQGLDAAELIEVADRLHRADWAAIGRLFDEVTSVAALENTIDHTDLIFQAVRTLDSPTVRQRWRERIKLVVVDEYQDADPLQVELLDALAGDGRDLIVVGDPYQSIYEFRGADVRGILDFAEKFGAPTRILSHTNRYGAAIGAAVRSVVENRGALGPVDGPAYAALRNPQTRAHDPGQVEVRTYSSANAEAEHIALTLREAHLHDKLPWSDMAVLVRTGADLTRLQRVLAAAGVPVEVAGDELPLAAEPAVRTLLAALYLADALSRGEPLTTEQAESVLTGPLGNLDAAGLRRLGRALRRAEPGHPQASRVLIAQALAEPLHLETLPAAGPTRWAADTAARLARLLAKAARQIRDGASAEHVLWTLWDAPANSSLRPENGGAGASWPTRLRREAESNNEGAPRANHDLDAVCQLFAEAARAEEKAAHRSVAEFVRAMEAQQIPADSLVQSGGSGTAVQLMTAHRSKGLEWPLVVVASVQDGVWPSMRSQGTVLQAERLAPDQVLSAPSARSVVAQERRLFYVACSRARERLLVTAVASGNDEGDQPSRFVAELHAHLRGSDTPSLPEALHRPLRTLSLRGAIAELRRLGTSDDPGTRERAAVLLARLAAQPAGRAAHPDRWWGVAPWSRAEEPVRDPTTALRLSGSQLVTLGKCSLQWFADHEARGSRAASSAQGFGSIIHAIVAEVLDADLEPDAAVLAAHLDDVWDALGYPPWVSSREKREAVAALERFVAWHNGSTRTPLAAEFPFDVTFQVAGRDVRLTGAMDRVDLGVDGVHVVDFKTSKKAVTLAEASEHPQLGAYQIAVEHGATAEIAPGAPAAGAQLVYLRQGSRGVPVIRSQSAAQGVALSHEQLRDAIAVIDEEAFAARVGDACGFCHLKRICPAHDEGVSIVAEELP